MGSAEKDNTEYGTGGLEEIQDFVVSVIRQPLTPGYKLDFKRVNKSEIESVIRPNSRMTSIERMEIYAQQYWYRLLDSLREDFPGIRAVLGEERFKILISKYIEVFPSGSFLMRDLGKHMPEFVLNHQELTEPYTDIVYDLARFEWAQVFAFDAEAHKPVTLSDIESSNVDELVFELQPYVFLLELDYPLDELSIALKAQMRNAAVTEAQVGRDRSKEKDGKIQEADLPEKEKNYLVVHRFDNRIFFKRLEPQGFKLLKLLCHDRIPLALACSKLLEEMPEYGDNPDALSAKLTDWFATWARLKWLIKSA